MKLSHEVNIFGKSLCLINILMDLMVVLPVYMTAHHMSEEITHSKATGKQRVSPSRAQPQ